MEMLCKYEFIINFRLRFVKRIRHSWTRSESALPRPLTSANGSSDPDDGTAQRLRIRYKTITLDVTQPSFELCHNNDLSFFSTEFSIAAIAALRKYYLLKKVVKIDPKSNFV